MLLNRRSDSGKLVDFEKPWVIHQIVVNVSSSEFTFTFIVTIIISVFVPGRSRVVQNCKSGFVAGLVYLRYASHARR